MKLENKQIEILVALIIAFVLLVMLNADKSKYSFNPQVIAKMIVEKGEQV